MIWRLSTPNNFVAYGQKHKVWVLVFLVMEERNTLIPNLGGLDEIFYFATQPRSISFINDAAWY